MSNEVFQQNLNDEKGSRPGGPYLIQMLFKRAGVYAWKSRNDRRDGKTHRDGRVFLSR